MSIDWYEHARLSPLFPRAGKTTLLAGPLHTVVDLALRFSGGVTALCIITDGGAMFCHDEITRLAADPTYRPPD